LGADEAGIRSCVAALLDRGILSDRGAGEGNAGIADQLRGTYGRDPTELLDHYRRARMEGAHPYWSVQTPCARTDTQGLGQRVDVLLLGDCDLQMEADFLRREGAARGVDLRVPSSFSADIGLAAERKHDAVLTGALQARHA